MKIEILSLVMMTFFFLLAWFPASIGKAQNFGWKWLASNRNPLKDKVLPDWAARCDRAHNNLKDNFPGFAVAILALLATNRFDGLTEVASVLYVAGRIGHFTSYGFGNVPLRGLCFFIALFSNLFLLLKVLL